MSELCMMVMTVALAGVAVALMVLVWKFRPVPDSEAIDMAAQRQQASFEQGIQWQRQVTADREATMCSPTMMPHTMSTAAPVVPPEEKKFPGEESVEMSMQC